MSHVYKGVATVETDTIKLLTDNSFEALSQLHQEPLPRHWVSKLEKY